MQKMKMIDITISKVIRKNLEQLMNVYGLSVSSFCQYLEDKDETAPHRTTFTRFMKNSEKTASIGFLISCCRTFNLSLDNLTSEQFNPKENYYKNKEKFAYISKPNTNLNIVSKDSDLIYSEYSYPVNEVFVENPNSPILKKYLQTYYCYYYSTVSSENKTDDAAESILCGTLKLEPDGKCCKATLSIDTKTFDEDGNRNYKVYQGKVIVCPSIQSIHCIMSLPEGEFCFLVFRYSHLNFASQECRIAEVLSTSSTPDKRYPIVHRMLLIKEEIREEDMKIIAPHLWLNYSDITVSKVKLMELSQTSEKYNQIVQEIMRENSEEMYCIKEKTAIKIAEKFLTKDELPMFTTCLRAHSFNYRYNKVSLTADNSLRDVLLQLGYFQTSASDTSENI